MMGSTPVQLVELMVEPAIKHTREKPLFRRPFIRMGRFLFIVGLWAYERGGVLGYSLQGQARLLGKLLGAAPEMAVEFVDGLAQDAKSDLEAARDLPLTFVYLYTMRELASLGFEVPFDPNDPRLREKWYSEHVGWPLTLAFSRGAALGYHMPHRFEQYWYGTFGSHCSREASGVRQFEVAGFPTGPADLKDAVHVVCAYAAQWANAVSEPHFEERETDVLKSLSGELSQFI